MEQGDSGDIVSVDLRHLRHNLSLGKIIVLCFSRKSLFSQLVGGTNQILVNVGFWVLMEKIQGKDM